RAHRVGRQALLRQQSADRHRGGHAAANLVACVIKPYHPSRRERTDMSDVFISYQRAERSAVTIIVEKLTELRLDVWFDSKLSPGATFDEDIGVELDKAKAVLVCWTPAAI